jgi:hypothetical protein
MISLLIGILIICVVGGICFWAIEQVRSCSVICMCLFDFRQAQGSVGPWVAHAALPLPQPQSGSRCRRGRDSNGFHPNQES